MAKKTKEKAAKKQRKGLRILLSLLFLLSVLVLLAGFLYFSAWKLFYDNPRFTLRKVIVRSPGWWNNRSRQLINILDLKTGSDKLFQIDLSLLRKRVKSLANVASAKVTRKLPDTLKIEIIERTPRAFLLRRDSKFLTDERCVAVPRSNCINVSKNLPVILGFDKELLNSKGVIEEIKPALEVIMLTARYYPSMRIKAISVRDKDHLQFYLIWRDDYKNPYRVFMPYKNLHSMLDILRSAILKARLLGERRSQINLSFDGTVVFR